MHSKRTKTIIGTHKSVYRDLSAGKLEEIFGRMLPHQQGFDSDSQRSFPVAVDYLSAFALKQCVVAGVMSAFSHSTAVAAPFTGVVCVSNNKWDSFIEASCFESFSEEVCGYPQNFLVISPSLRLESLEILYANASIIPECKIGDVPHNLTYPVLDEVPLSESHSSELLPCTAASFVSETLQPFSSQKDLLAPDPDVFTRIELFQNSTIWRENSNSKAFAVYINANHVLPFSDVLLFGKESNNLAIGSQSVGFAYPAIGNQITVSLEVSVLANCSGNALSWIQAKLNKEITLCIESLAVPGNIELDSDCPDHITFASHDIALNIADNLAVEVGGLFGN